MLGTPESTAACSVRPSGRRGELESWVGREAIQAATSGLFADQPDLDFEPVRVYLGVGHSVSEYVMTGSRDGKSFACDGAMASLRARTPISTGHLP